MTCALQWTGKNRKKHPRASSAWRFETACQRTIAEADVIRPRLSVTLGVLSSHPTLCSWSFHELCKTPQRDASEDMVPQAGPGSNSQIDCFQCVTALRRWMFQNWHWHCLLTSSLNPKNLSGPLPKHCTRSHIDA